MKHSTASGTAHAVSHKIKIYFLKNHSKSLFFYSQISVSQRHTDILARNTGYSLYSSGSGEVQVMVCTEKGTDKCNVVPFLCNCSTSAALNTNCCTFPVQLQYICSTQYQLLHNVYLFLQHLLASGFGHLHAACCSVVV